MASSRFHNSVDATGVVDFDNDQATSVLAPISGPVSRLLVQPGDKVRKGQPLAIVASPDYAEAISTYRKAVGTAQTARHLADMDKDLLAHDGVALREEQQAQTDAAGAEADRDAALQALVALNVDPQTIRSDVQQGRRPLIPHRRLHPFAHPHRRNRGGEIDHTGENLLRGRHHRRVSP